MKETANILLEKRNNEIYEGFMAATQELCEATEEIERLKNIIERAKDYIEMIQYNESYGVKEKDYLELLDILEGE